MATAEQISSWTYERTEALRKLWPEGHSASVIAARLGGISRMAVIGKARRLGLAERRTTVRFKSLPLKPSRTMGGDCAPKKRGNGLVGTTVPQLREAHAKMKAAPTFLVEPLPVFEEPGAGGGGFTLDELPPNGCRFPLGPAMAKAEYFCGADRREGSSYCEKCHARCHQGARHAMNIHPSATVVNTRRKAA